MAQTENEKLDLLLRVVFEDENLSLVGENMEELVAVCINCLRASCWQGMFFCDEYKESGVVIMEKSYLEKQALEHPDYWENEGHKRRPQHD